VGRSATRALASLERELAFFCLFLLSKAASFASSSANKRASVRRFASSISLAKGLAIVLDVEVGYEPVHERPQTSAEAYVGNRT
jgi:hypothetical protein